MSKSVAIPKIQRGVSRGDIYYADLDPVVGSERGGNRPVLVLQNNIGNKYAPTVIVSVLTCKEKPHSLPTHIPLKNPALSCESYTLIEQVRTIDESRPGEVCCYYQQRGYGEGRQRVGCIVGAGRGKKWKEGALCLVSK